MTRYLRSAAIAAGLVCGTYLVLFIAAAAAPSSSKADPTSRSTVVADQLKAEAALLAQREPSARPPSQ